MKEDSSKLGQKVKSQEEILPSTRHPALKYLRTQIKDSAEYTSMKFILMSVGSR